MDTNDRILRELVEIRQELRRLQPPSRQKGARQKKHLECIDAVKSFLCDKTHEVHMLRHVYDNVNDQHPGKYTKTEIGKAIRALGGQKTTSKIFEGVVQTVYRFPRAYVFNGELNVFEEMTHDERALLLGRDEAKTLLHQGFDLERLMGGEWWPTRIDLEAGIQSQNPKTGVWRYVQRGLGSKYRIKRA